MVTGTALDVSGKTVDEVSQRIADLLGIPIAEPMEVTRRLRAQVPPITLVVDGVDDTAEPVAMPHRPSRHPHRRPGAGKDSVPQDTKLSLEKALTDMRDAAAAALGQFQKMAVPARRGRDHIRREIGRASRGRDRQDQYSRTFRGQAQAGTG